MGKTTIEWCDHSINPFRAHNADNGKSGHYCEKISAGCKHCYASRFQPRLGLFPYLAQNRSKAALFLDDRALQQVLRRKEPTRFFWCDMTDMFLDAHPDKWIDRCFATMALTPHHTHLVLTKRPERMLRWATTTHPNPQGWPPRDYDVQTCIRLSMGGLIQAKTLPNGRPDVGHFLNSGAMQRYEAADRRLFHQWPLPNVWLGVSCENQATAEERIPPLLQTPAAVRFISAEPLLGPIDLTRSVTEVERYENGDTTWRKSALHEGDAWHAEDGDVSDGPHVTSLDWVIIGGESGPGARPLRTEWIESLVRQCQDSHVACFVKQLGSNVIRDGTRVDTKHKKGGDMSEWPDYLRVRHYPAAETEPMIKTL